MVSSAASLLLFVAAPLAASPQQFVEVAAARGIEPFAMAKGLCGGVAAADFDGDGDIDLFAPTGQGFGDQLYRNRGRGRFEEVAAQLGLASTDNNRSALWFDPDGDGDLDLLVASDCHEDGPCAFSSSLRLWEQRDGTFVDVTSAAGLDGDFNIEEDTHVGGMCAGDVDGDGWLDLLVSFWEGYNFLFHNDGAGGFTDVTLASGMRAQKGFWQPVLHDFNRDGLLDIFQAVDFQPNHLWINRGDLTFFDVAPEAGVDSAFNEMGVALGDYDNDGDFDLYVTNLFLGPRHNVLFQNGTDFARRDLLAFDEIAESAGVDDGGCGWGTTFLDGDHDGWLDLAAANGGPAFCASEPPRYFENLGGRDPGFADAAATTGFDNTREGHGLVAFDSDRDGDLELVQVCADGSLLLYDNTLAARGNHLVVRPRMRGPNRFAIGAIVRVRVGRRLLSRLITAGTSNMSQEPAEAHFGLPAGGPQRVDVIVEWPNGRVTERRGIEPGRTLTLER